MSKSPQSIARNFIFRNPTTGAEPAHIQMTDPGRVVQIPIWNYPDGFRPHLFPDLPRMPKIFAVYRRIFHRSG